MTGVIREVCRRLGRRPASLDELTEEERRALAADVESRAARPLERRGNAPHL